MYGRHSRPVEHVRRVLCAVRVIYGGKARFLRLDPGDTPSAPSAQARALRVSWFFRSSIFRSGLVAALSHVERQHSSRRS